MKIYLGSDHAIVEDKKILIDYVREKHGHELIDLGTHSSESCHYPPFAKAVCEKVLSEEACLGILICGTGVGMSMAANRYKGIRAGLVKTKEEAKLTKEHNNCNVLCLGSRSSSLDEIKEMISTWLEASFEGGRHQERISMFDQLGV